MALSVREMEGVDENTAALLRRWKVTLHEAQGESLPSLSLALVFLHSDHLDAHLRPSLKNPPSHVQFTALIRSGLIKDMLCAFSEERDTFWAFAELGEVLVPFPGGGKKVKKKVKNSNPPPF